MRISFGLLIPYFLTLTVARAQVCATELLQPGSLVFDHDSYMSVVLKKEDFKAAEEKAERVHGSPLIHRDEVHLTVVIPPEYIHLSAADRHALGEDLKRLDWSKPQITVKCMGRGQMQLQGRLESTYFLVVAAPEIVKIRAKYRLGQYFPHVTLGFTKRDLHYEDGVKKDASSCL